MKINKILAAAAIALPLQIAHAQEPAINAQLAAIDMGGFDTGLALMVGYEHPAEFIFKNVSIEGEVTASVVNPVNDYSLAGVNYEDETSFYTVGAYLKYTHPVNQTFSAYGRVGVHYESVTRTESNSIVGTFFDDTDSGLGRNFGVGINLDMGPAVSFTAGATRIMTDTNLAGDINLISVGAKFKL